MNTLHSSSELKSKAKGQLLGKYKTAILVLLLSQGLTSLILFTITGFLNINTSSGLALSYCFTFIMELVAAIFTVGQNRLYLNIACSQPFSVNDAFYGFHKCPDKAIKIQFFLTLLGMLCMAPCIILSLIYLYTKQIYLIPFLTLAGIIGCIFACIIALTYAQVFYLILDFPTYSVKELMHASKLLMKGYKGKLFYLKISFLPLMLLSACSCGIASLWIIPYSNATYVNFYLNLIAIKSEPHN
ncbi:MAG: DUF975 family protein [Lachnospiraceae bacterium]